MRRFFVACLVSVAIATPLLADPAGEDALAELVKKALTAPDPVTTVLGGIGQLRDLRLSGAEVRNALKKADAPVSGVVAKLLGEVRSLSKRGNQVTIERSKTTTVPLGGGRAIELGPSVTFRVSKQGRNFFIDGFQGVRVGQNGKMYTLYDLRTGMNGRTPQLHIHAGWGIFSDIVTVDLPTPNASSPPSGNRTGITSRVGG